MVFYIVGFFVILLLLGLPISLSFQILRQTRKAARRANDKTVSLVMAELQKVDESLQIGEKDGSALTLMVSNLEETDVRRLIQSLDLRSIRALTMIYKPEWSTWEAFEMSRKLVLDGFMVVIGRGSISQSVLYVIMCVLYFAAVCKAEPFKFGGDNALKAATELHLLLVAVVAVLIKSEQLSKELEEIYDWVLFMLFVLMVFMSFWATVCLKLWKIRRMRNERHTSHMKHTEAWRAYNRYKLALDSASDATYLLEWIENICLEHRLQQRLNTFNDTVEGRNRKSSQTEDTGLEVLANDVEPDTTENRPATGSRVMSAPLSCAPTETLDALEKGADEYYGKFSLGFVGTFADLDVFHGGLEKLIGECSKDVATAMKEEHQSVAPTVIVDGAELMQFGASEVDFTTSNYSITTQPKQEWQFVVQPSTTEDLPAGMDIKTSRDLGLREKIEPAVLLANAAVRMTEKFAASGYGLQLTQRAGNAEACKSPLCAICRDPSHSAQGLTCKSKIVLITDGAVAVDLLLVEIIGLRLYTGPMFELCECSTALSFSAFRCDSTALTARFPLPFVR